MTVPYYISENQSDMRDYISENQSDMRGIKHGWYAIEDDGNVSSGPFPSFEACGAKINQPANGTTAPKLPEGPN